MPVSRGSAKALEPKAQVLRTHVTPVLLTLGSSSLLKCLEQWRQLSIVYLELDDPSVTEVTERERPTARGSPSKPPHCSVTPALRGESPPPSPGARLTLPPPLRSLPRLPGSTAAPLSRLSSSACSAPPFPVRLASPVAVLKARLARNPGVPGRPCREVGPAPTRRRRRRLRWGSGPAGSPSLSASPEPRPAPSPCGAAGVPHPTAPSSPAHSGARRLRRREGGRAVGPSAPRGELGAVVGRKPSASFLSRWFITCGSIARRPRAAAGRRSAEGSAGRVRGTRRAAL